MQIKKWLFRPKILMTLLIMPYLYNIAYAANQKSHIDRALENSRMRLAQKKKSPLARQRFATPTPEKPVIDESKLTFRQRKKLHRKRVCESRIVKHMSDMNYDELLAAKNKHVQGKNYTVALKYVEQLLFFCDPHEVADLTLEAGDLLYELGEYKKAAAKYSEFALYNPGNPRIEYGMYRAIKTQFQTTLTPDRDQTNTHGTLALVDQFLDRKSVFTTYLPEVLEIQKECFKKLAESELKISEFYIKQEQYKSAVTRMQKIKNEYLAKAGDMHERFAQVEQLLPEDQRMLLHQDSITLQPKSSIMIAEHTKSNRPAVERF